MLQYYVNKINCEWSKPIPKIYFYEDGVHGRNKSLSVSISIQRKNSILHVSQKCCLVYQRKFKRNIIDKLFWKKMFVALNDDLYIIGSSLLGDVPLSTVVVLFRLTLLEPVTVYFYRRRAILFQLYGESQRINYQHRSLKLYVIIKVDQRGIIYFDR